MPHGAEALLTMAASGQLSSVPICVSCLTFNKLVQHPRFTADQHVMSSVGMCCVMLRCAGGSTRHPLVDAHSGCWTLAHASAEAACCSAAAAAAVWLLLTRCQTLCQLSQACWCLYWV
jgi:hypothetical protein